MVVGTADGTSFYDDGLAGSTTYRYEVFTLGSGRRSAASTLDVTTGSSGHGGSLEFRESFTEANLPEALDALTFASVSFEALLPEERPYLEQRETSVPFSTVPYVEGLMESVLIDIEGSGRGSRVVSSGRRVPARGAAATRPSRSHTN